MSDIVFILDKMELIREAVSQIGQDGKFNTVAADRQNRNSFLKICLLYTSWIGKALRPAHCIMCGYLKFDSRWGRWLVVILNLSKSSLF